MANYTLFVSQARQVELSKPDAVHAAINHAPPKEENHSCSFPRLCEMSEEKLVVSFTCLVATMPCRNDALTQQYIYWKISNEIYLLEYIVLLKVPVY